MHLARDERGRFVGKKDSRSRAERPAPACPRPSKSLVAELRASWKRHGAQAIQDILENRPHDYVRLVASLARPPEPERTSVEAMSDKEIADEIRAIRKRLAASGIDPLE